MTDTSAKQSANAAGQEIARRRGQGDNDAHGLVTRVGSVEIDWPRSLGYFGGTAVAVAAGVIDPPLGIFIAAVPFLKMLDLPHLPDRFRFVAQVFEGVAKPVGGDSQGTVRIVTPEGASDEPVQGSG